MSISTGQDKLRSIPLYLLGVYSALYLLGVYSGVSCRKEKAVLTTHHCFSDNHERAVGLEQRRIGGMERSSYTGIHDISLDIRLIRPLSNVLAD